MNTSINDICKVLLTIEMSHNHFNSGRRREFLKEHFNFDCRCSRCESELATAAAAPPSDLGTGGADEGGSIFTGSTENWAVGDTYYAQMAAAAAADGDSDDDNDDGDDD